MEPRSAEADAEAAHAIERRFVLALGGFALEIAGATLVTHEHLPVPRFNYVEVHGVSRERQSAFFERALDHYFQRALRPSFRVPIPVPVYLDAGLRRFGFRPRSTPRTTLTAGPAAEPPATNGVRPRLARASELDLVGSFWAPERERPQLRAALAVAIAHPNPHESLAPMLAFSGGEAVSAALVFRHRSTAGIFAVATRPPSRGRGAASDLVGFVRSSEPAGPAERYALWADSERLTARLSRLGFEPVGAEMEYELPPGAELALPDPGPVTPPRWRPPRTRGP